MPASNPPSGPEKFSFDPPLWGICWVKVPETGSQRNRTDTTSKTVTEVTHRTQRELGCFELLKAKLRYIKNFESLSKNRLESVSTKLEVVRSSPRQDLGKEPESA